jgi:polar amino acid transport system substrate-binding protein
MSIGSSAQYYGVFILLALLTASGCGNLPRDPGKTLERVTSQHRIRIGLVENPPWVIHSAGEPAGAEVELAREFAQSLGASPDWFRGGEQGHMEALERFELDLVIGGLDATTPWSGKIGITRPYFEEQFIVGVPPGSPPLESLNGVKVAVRSGEATASRLAEKHAIPVRMPDISHVAGPIAAPAWRLEQMGFIATQFHLSGKKHVMAVPPGENEWLKRLGDFLQQQKPNVQRLLQASEAIR